MHPRTMFPYWATSSCQLIVSAYSLRFGALRDQTLTYGDGTAVGWWKVQDRSWYEREAWRFDGR